VRDGEDVRVGMPGRDVEEAGDDALAELVVRLPVVPAVTVFEPA
jgi:hypothetical protein